MSAPGYEQLVVCSWSPSDQTTVDKYTKKKKATDWTKPTLSDLRTRLRAEVIRSQGSACAYCRRRISEELGLHDLDHILPKGIALYARFTYERMNLVASCKRCNRNKLDSDVLKNRPLAADASYPLGSDDYLWVHPYIHRYSSHIRIREGLLFEARGSALHRARANAVINACGLKTLAGVEHRRAAETAIYATEVIDAITTTIGNHRGLNDADIVAVLRQERKELTGLKEESVLRMVSAYRQHNFSEFERELKRQKLK